MVGGWEREGFVVPWASAEAEIRSYELAPEWEGSLLPDLIDLSRLSDDRRTSNEYRNMLKRQPYYLAWLRSQRAELDYYPVKNTSYQGLYVRTLSQLKRSQDKPSFQGLFVETLRLMKQTAPTEEALEEDTKLIEGAARGLDFLEEAEAKDRFQTLHVLFKSA